MKVAILLCLFTIAVAAPQQDRARQDITVLRDNRDVRPDGYHFEYELSDGSSRSETGEPVDETGTLGSQGEYTIVYPNGFRMTVTFVADATGYRPRITFEN